MSFQLLDYQVYSAGKLELKDRVVCHLRSSTATCETINCLNPHSYVVAKTDRLFRAALLQSDVLLPDGVGITLGARIYGERIERVTGFDVFEMLISVCDELGLNVLFLGSDEATLAKIIEKCEKAFPSLTNVYVYSPPYKAEFDDFDKAKMLNFIDKVAPDIIFVGMSAPKQEKWASEFRSVVSARYIVSIGAVFDFFVGNVKRSPKIFRTLGLEWFPRLLQQPKRLARRTFVSAPIFVYDIIKDKLSKVLFK